MSEDIFKVASLDVLNDTIDCDRVDTDTCYRWAVITKLKSLAGLLPKTKTEPWTEKERIEHYYDMTFNNY